MHSYDILNIQLQSSIPEEKNLYDFSEDTLDEFTAFQLALKRFCFEQNRYVLLEIGTEKIELYLYHDILDSLEDKWCEQIDVLSKGNEISLDFSNFNVRFNPVDDKVICKFGFILTEESKIKILRLSQVLENMSNFLNILLALMVQEGYATAEDIYENLRWRL